jgi:hypothetical protein
MLPRYIYLLYSVKIKNTFVPLYPYIMAHTTLLCVGTSIYYTHY